MQSFVRVSLTAFFVGRLARLLAALAFILNHLKDTFASNVVVVDVAVAVVGVFEHSSEFVFVSSVLLFVGVAVRCVGVGEEPLPR